MKKETIIWIIIAVVAIAMIVGGFFAFRSVLKKDDNGGNKGGSSNSGTNKGGANNGGSQNNNGSDNPDKTGDVPQNISVSVLAKAKMLEKAISGPGTDDAAITKVLNGVGTQQEWDEILAAYLAETGVTFKKDLKNEWGYLTEGMRKSLAKPLTDKGIDSKFI